MKVLWFAAGAMPAVREHLKIKDLGNRNVWVANAASALAKRENIELGIVWPTPLVSEAKNFLVDGVTYFCIPTGGNLESISNRLHRWPAIRKLWQLATWIPRQMVGKPLGNMAALVDDFEPDVVHFHGTEGFYALLASQINPPGVISLQGILQAVHDAYWGSIPWWKRPLFPLEMFLHWQMRWNASRENRIIRQGKYFTGRTDWDRRTLATINPTAKYFSDGARLLRKEFYAARWSIQQSVQYRLYTTATSRPYKGTDTLLLAVYRLQGRYPDISLNIGGYFPDSGYGAYLRRMIKKLGLQKRVRMLGFMEGEDIIREMQNAHAYIIGSYIENSPNSVAEAQLVGLPTIATRVGGTPSLVEDGRTGLLYRAGDVTDLAQKIERVFTDDEFAAELGRGASLASRERSDESALTDRLLEIYRQVLADEREMK